MVATRWSRTRQGRRELTAAGLFVVVFATVPLVRTELYPFSRAPMFADAPLCYCEYTITDPNGKQLDSAAFGLQRSYWGNPLGVGVGFEPLPSLDQFGEVPSRDAVTIWVQERLARFPDLPGVELEQTVFGPLGDGSVGVTQCSRWFVRNPASQGAGR